MLANTNMHGFLNSFSMSSPLDIAANENLCYSGSAQELQAFLDFMSRAPHP